MATEGVRSHRHLLAALDALDWSVALQAVAAADARIRGSIVGDPEIEEIVAKLIALASHTKWEVRRAVANAAAHAPHPTFEEVLAKLALDDNSRVRQAAEQAALRRRDSRHASTLGKQHEDRINSILDGIEVRFGPRGRDAVKRAAEQIANTFARELYHEVIKLLSPLALSADRLKMRLSAGDVPPETLADEAERIGRRVTQLRRVLEAMRTYTAQPALEFKTEVLREVIQEGVSVALESDVDKSRRPSIDIKVPSNVVVDVVRARLVQALTNILMNAIESYRDIDSLKPIEISADVLGALVTVSVSDSGCGMSSEVQRDAFTLFATSKPNGTGFGLPLAVKIIESEHGGRLNVDSVKGRGTIVRMTIPLHRRVDPA
ncbi:MAG TPA: ATP-binding protein [Terriglobales bacterium]|nr:ATP-binding protein [Terriglobales bacterium]